MKKLLSLLIVTCMMVIGTSGQTEWFSKVGLSQDLAPYHGYQIQTKTTNQFVQVETVTRVNNKYVYTYTYETTKKDELFGYYPLNLMYDYTAEFNTTYMGIVDGAPTWSKPGEFKTITSGPNAGQTYYYGWSTAIVKDNKFSLLYYPYMNTNRDGTPATEPWISVRTKVINATKPGTTYPPMWTTRTLTRSQFIARFGLTDEQLANLQRVDFNFVAVNPATHITSIFGHVTKQGDDYLNTTMINGIDWHQQVGKGLITSFGKPLSAMEFSWIVYNECPIGTTTALTSGNLGECYRKAYAETDPRANKITVSQGNAFIINADGTLVYDQNKTAIIEVCPARTPMPDKNTEQSGYLNLNTGQTVYSLFHVN